jgi:multidrug efflux pump subunit AcrB
MSSSKNIFKGPIAWMTSNSVAANLLMIFLLVGGFFWGSHIKQEVFPEFELDLVEISVEYPGASPEEVEQGIILPVEEAIQNINGIEEITSTANEGSGVVRVEAPTGGNLQQLATDIKNEVDRITTFPDEAKEPLVTIPSRKRQVITLIVYGSQTRKVLREITERIRDQLIQDKEITQAELLGDNPLEMSVEIPQDVLRTYNLTLADVAAKIKNASLDLPGGAVKTLGGEILVRMKERKDYQQEYAVIPIITTATGTIVRLGDIAKITDGFAETDQFLVYNNMPALGIDVFRLGKQTPISVADAVLAHVKELQKTLPDGVFVSTVNDRSEMFRQRINLLLRNGLMGLTLVFVLLGLFLEARLAFWVTMGIPISFLGSLLFIPHFGVSINMISLFAFIICLGIVVDDTIVIGENVFSYKQQGLSAFDAAVKGAREIATPVTFSILTNIVTFLPLYFVPGVMGKIFRTIPVVVTAVFLISLAEALFVLPAHLGHQKELKNPTLRFFTRQQQKFSNWFTSFVHKVYGPSIKLSLRFRYVSVTIGIVILMLTLAYVKSGRMGITMFPKIEADLAYASATLPVGVNVRDTLEVHDKLMQAADNVIQEIGREKQVQGVLSSVNKNTLWIQVHMIDPDSRLVNTSDFTKKWREAAGSIPGTDSLKFEADHGGPGSGAALTIELQHRDTQVLEKASKELAKALGFFPLVSDIDDGYTAGKDQFDFRLNQVGYQIGLTPMSVAQQIRNAYYGYEALTQLRGRNEIKIRVRQPENERQSEYYLEEMLIATPTGVKVPLADIADVTKGKAYTTITRRDGRRVVSVTADVTPQSQAEMILDSVKKDTLPALKEKYQGLNFSFEGKQADRKESMAALGNGIILALMVVYMLLAIPFKSYIQPAIIMVSIPFGIVGAIVGHLIMGYSLSLLSMFGIVALSGVVVNDALVLIDFANRQVREGSTHYAAIINAGTKRFRPILLTTLTTFFGLMPMIFESSRQARFLVPMAISLGFGILFSTFIVLVLVPSLYIIVEDVKSVFKKFISLLGPTATL